MAQETSTFNLQDFGDIGLEEMSEDEIDSRHELEFADYVKTIAEVVSMAADGHAGIISGFQALYAAEELDTMYEVLLAAWKKHYQALSDEKISEELDGLLENKMKILGKTNEIFKDNSSEEMKATFKREVEVIEEIIDSLNSPAGRRKVVEDLSQNRVPRGIFHLYDTAHEYGGFAHDGSISEKYHAAIDEFHLVTDILVGVYGLGEQEVRYLARQLKKATKQVSR